MQTAIRKGLRLQKVSDHVWRSMCLPFSLGGLGFVHATNIAPLAYLASWSLFAHNDLRSSIPALDKALNSEMFLDSTLHRRIQQTIDSVTVLGDVVNTGGTPITPTTIIQSGSLFGAAHFKLQKSLTEAFHKKDHEAWLKESSADSKSRLRSAMSGTSSSYLSIPPTNKLHGYSNNEFRILLALRFGLPIPSWSNHPESKCTQCHEILSDIRGMHLLDCKKSRFNTLRHDRTTKRIAQFLRQAGFDCRLEYVPFPDSRKRLDILIYSYDGKDRDALLDVTFTNQSCKSYLAKAANENGYAAKQAAEAKHKKYSKYIDTLQDPKPILIPFAIETGGRWGKDAHDFFKHVIKRAHKFRTIPPKFAANWKANLCSSIHHEVARSVLNKLRLRYRAGETVPSYPFSDFMYNQQAPFIADAPPL